MMWLSIFGMAAITFLNRYAFLANTLSFEPSEKFKRLLSYSSYSVLTAIWTPIIFQVDHHVGFSIAGVDYLIAGTLAAAMTFFRFPSLLSVIASASVFFGIRFYC